MKSNRITLLMCLWLAAGAQAYAQSAAPADFIFYNGKIVTVDDKFTVAEALAVKAGKIAAVGSTAEVEKVAGDSTVRIDLKGKSVIPGLIDTHSHVHDYAVGNFGKELGPSRLREYPVNYKLVKTKDDVLKQIRDIMQTVKPKPGEWVNFGASGLSDPQNVKILYDEVNRWELDKVSPDNPIVVSMGIPLENGFLVNSKAIDIIWKEHGPFIEKYGRYWINAKGEPDGHLEPPANRFILYNYLPHPSKEDLASMFEKTIDEWASMGVTTISTRLPEESLHAYQLLESRGKLRARMAYGNEWVFGVEQPEKVFAGLKMGSGTDMVWLVSVTPGGVDGSGARQCTDLKRAGKSSEDEGAMGQALLADWYPRGQCHLDIEYKGAQGHGATIHGNYYKEWLVAAGKSGLRFANTHVAGDGAHSRLLTIMEEINAQVPMAKNKWALDHCTIVDPADIPRAVKLGAVWSCGPKYIEAAAGLEKAYGSEVANRYVLPIKSMIDAGIHVAFEMDEDDYIWKNIELLLTREANGKVWGAHERIDRNTALKTITRWAAEYVLRPDQIGTLETGKLADLVVLDRDFTTIPDNEFSEVQPLLTLLGGKVVFAQPAYASELKLKTDNAVVANYKDLIARHKR